MVSAEIVNTIFIRFQLDTILGSICKRIRYLTDFSTTTVLKKISETKTSLPCYEVYRGLYQTVSCKGDQTHGSIPVQTPKEEEQ